MNIELFQNGAEQIHTLLKIANKYVEQCVCVVEKNKIIFGFMDASHVCLSRLTLQNNTHYKLTSKENSLEGEKFELKTKDLIKILSRLDENTVIISSNIDPNDNSFLGLNFEIKSNAAGITIKEIMIPCFTHEQNLIVKETTYDKNTPIFKFETESLAETISELKDYDTENVFIEATEEDIDFDAVNKESLRKRIQIHYFDQINFECINKEDVELNEPIKGYYGMEYLQNLIVPNNEYKHVTVQFSNKKPISVTYLNDKTMDSNLICIVAPNVQE